MSLHNLHNLVGVSGLSFGGAGGYTGPQGAGGGAGASSYILVQQKIEEWKWMNRFIEQNLDIKERYEVHKTFEILNNEQL